jgi:hypothetical protein
MCGVQMPRPAYDVDLASSDAIKDSRRVFTAGLLALNNV